MKIPVKLFIYLAIIVLIAILSSPDMADAKSLTGMNNLMNMDGPPKDLSGIVSHVSRMRRDIDLRAADEGDIPKEGSRLRTRRQTPSGESVLSKGFQKDAQIFRAKRQMPSPPGEVPMPPM